jgi:peptidoglycan/LPS O-acetylase OafA/YrhL
VSRYDQSTVLLRILWSIGVEEQFYLLYPILLSAALLSLSRAKWIALTLLVTGVVFRLGFMVIPVDNPAMRGAGGMYYATLTYTDVFLAGAIAGWYAAWTAIRGHKYARILRSRLTGPLLLLALYALGVNWKYNIWYPYTPYTVAIYTLTGAVFASVIAWIVANRRSVASRVLRSPPLRALGTLSYGLYMWHTIAYYFLPQDLTSWLNHIPLFDRLDPGTVHLLYYLGGTLLMATITYFLIEQPFLRLRDVIIASTRHREALWPNRGKHKWRLATSVAPIVLAAVVFGHWATSGYAAAGGPVAAHAGPDFYPGGLQAAAERDKVRKADIRGLADALQHYYDTNGRYPCQADNHWVWSSGGEQWLHDDNTACGAPQAIPLTPHYVTQLPVDPRAGQGALWVPGSYVYGYRGYFSSCPEVPNGQFFVLGAQLESKADPDGQVRVMDCTGNTLAWPDGVFVVTSRERH